LHGAEIKKRIFSNTKPNEWRLLTILLSTTLERVVDGYLYNEFQEYKKEEERKKIEENVESEERIENEENSKREENIWSEGWQDYGLQAKLDLLKRLKPTLINILNFEPISEFYKSRNKVIHDNEYVPKIDLQRFAELIEPLIYKLCKKEGLYETIHTWVCPDCGTHNPLGENYCSSCTYDVRAKQVEEIENYKQLLGYTPLFLKQKIITLEEAGLAVCPVCDKHIVNKNDTYCVRTKNPLQPAFKERETRIIEEYDRRILDMIQERLFPIAKEIKRASILSNVSIVFVLFTCCLYSVPIVNLFIGVLAFLLSLFALIITSSTRKKVKKLIKDLVPRLRRAKFHGTLDTTHKIDLIMVIIYSLILIGVILSLILSGAPYLLELIYMIFNES